MRAVVLGNGSLLVTIDTAGLIADVYFDYVGLENQMGQAIPNKVGVFIDGQISWIGESDWQVAIDYQHDTMVGVVIAVNHTKQIEVVFTDAVYNEKNILLRKIKIINKGSQRDIKVFLHQQFHMYGIIKGDTVYFDPDTKAIVHYKGRRIVLVGAESNGQTFDDYTVGLAGIEGKEGTFKDAEDGVLSKNPVEHGSVDSTIGFQKNLKQDEIWTISTWMCLGKTLEEVKELNEYTVQKGVEYLIKSTSDFWTAWGNKEELGLQVLDGREGKKVQEIVKKSLFVIRTHMDNTGPIIASGDSDMLYYGRDTYSYVWHRDASYIAQAMDQAGYHESTQPFFEFSEKVIAPEGYFYHRYRSDRAIASSWHPWVNDEGEKILPIQEDETALTILALWNHYEGSKNLEFVERMYNPVIKKAANFMVSYRTKENLPMPSYDLWEMKYGIHTFTAAAVVASLRAASQFAKLLGKDSDEIAWTKVATEVQHAIEKYMWNEADGYFVKSVLPHNDELVVDPVVDASSIFAIVEYDIFPITDSKITRAWEYTKEKLTNKEGIGGIIRFEGDLYCRINNTSHSNPWIITTLWHAQYEIKKAQSRDNLQSPWQTILWATSRALSSGILSEQVNPYTGFAISATPLIWSHAEYVKTVLQYKKKWEELKK
jgi:GH15 family glucan-1,4-alpha-glucosidase